MQWVQLADGKTWCVAHAAEFHRPATCPQCADLDPADMVPLGAESDSDSFEVADCLSPAEHEQRFTRLAKRLTKKADALKSGTPREMAMATKFYELSIRAGRVAAELSHERHRRARVARLEREQRNAMKGRRH